MAAVPYWALDAQEVAKGLGVDPKQGLTEREVLSRRKKHGANKLEEGSGPHPAQILFAQFTDTMILILLAATVISGLLGEIVDAATILAIVVVNSVLGFIQEYRAERSLHAIKHLVTQKAVVLRDGVKQRVDASELVVGDVVYLEAGDRVAADIRLLNSFSLMIDESILTGESFPVSKGPLPVAEETVLSDRTSMAFMGTSVSRGHGVGVVVATGMKTVMGEIARVIKETETDVTPLQKRLEHLGKWLVALCLVICALVSMMGIIRGEKAITMFMSGVSLAVAAIPEGLPAIVTVVLALGVTRMAERNAIVRRLPAVETLGCTTVICTDKTGTLTQNQMTVKRVWVGDDEIEVEGEGYEPRGGFLREGMKYIPKRSGDFMLLAQAARSCNNAEIYEERGYYSVLGDPTEGALLVMALKAGVMSRGKVIREIPFDSERKMMSVVVNTGKYDAVYSKGALDVLLPLCRWVRLNGKDLPLTEERRKRILAKQNEWAEKAYRVLAVAYRPTPHGQEKLSERELEKELVFLGLCAMIDPARREVKHSVNQCWQAGIIPVMITGDHPATAAAIAKEVGISDGKRVIKGSEIDGMSERELAKTAEEVRVFARVTPQHKHMIVKALKKQGHVVAMTGDGVNDAPAVKEADIGISMGKSGTEVTREASDMVLADDNFATIVAAVHEGRAIYDNIRKFLRYLLGCNTGEVLTMFLASLFCLPIPMLPIHILWVNLVTDGLPAMGLGLEPAEPHVMKRRPRAKEEGIFAHGLGYMIAARGVFIGLTTVLVFWLGLTLFSPSGAPNLALARTMAFTHLVFSQLFFVFECRSEVYSPFELGLGKNPFLLLAVMISVIMQLLAVNAPFFNALLRTVPIPAGAWGIILALAGGRLLFSWFKYTWQSGINYSWQYVKMNQR